MKLGPRVQHIQTICLFILATIALCAALYLLRPILIPLILAVFLTYCLSPIIAIQMRYLRLPRSLAIVSTIVIGCVLLVCVSIFLATSIERLAQNADIYKERSIELVNKALDYVPYDVFGFEPHNIQKTLLDGSGKYFRGLITGTISGFMGVLSHGILVIIFMIFLIIGKRPLKKAPHGIFVEIEQKIRRYVMAMFFISLATGVLVGTTLQFLNIQLAFVFGFLAFLLNFIPNIGSIIATLLPLPIVVLNPELSIFIKILAFVIPAAIQMIIGNLIAPKVLGETLELHPIVVLCTLVFFGMIWGVVGMFLAVPIASVIKIVLKRFDYSAPLAHLMEGKLEEFDVLLSNHPQS